MKNNKTSQISELANQYGRQVFQTAYRLLGDKHLAEDIVQDVFIKLLKKDFTAFDQIQSWPAYLKVMATSASYDFLRKKSRQAEQTLEDNPAQSLESAHQNSPEKSLMLSRDMSSFRKALGEITQLEANVFLLRYVEEFSYQEISEQLSITSGNVGIALNRAKQRLSKILKGSAFSGANYETK